MVSSVHHYHIARHPTNMTFLPVPQPFKAGTQFNDLRGKKGWVGWLPVKVVYPPEDGRPSQY